MNRGFFAAFHEKTDRTLIISVVLSVFYIMGKCYWDIKNPMR